MRLLHSFGLSLLAASVTASPQTQQSGQNNTRSLTVRTTNGLITGHLAGNVSSVVEFLGIPFAKPPVGELRFAAPQRLNTTAPFVATNWGFDCPQNPAAPSTFAGLTNQAQRILDNFAAVTKTNQSEDCLTLNIWSKATNRVQKPTVVFFYGGKFIVGNTNTPFYQGKYLADAQDLIVVTVNYRVNVFGFPGVPNAPDQQNLGLRDQRIAVEWVRDNIAAFGGDPTKIVIAGQSAGSAAVDYWAYAYPDDPIVSGIMAHSGVAFSFPFNSANVTESNWYNISAQLGCGSSGDTLACMRRANWTDIKFAATKVKPIRIGTVVRNTPGFYPTIDNRTVFADYVQRSRDGRFAKVPLLLGNNHNEQGWYVIPAFADGITANDAQTRQFLLESFTCPNSLAASDRVRQNVPTWLFRYFGDWDNLRLHPTSGAYHGCDMQMVFGTSEDTSGLATNSTERQVAKLWQSIWSAFAEDPRRGLSTKLGWPTFNPGLPTLAQIALESRSDINYTFPATFDAQCGAVEVGSLATKIATVNVVTTSAAPSLSHSTSLMLFLLFVYFFTV